MSRRHARVRRRLLDRRGPCTTSTPKPLELAENVAAALDRAIEAFLADLNDLGQEPGP